MRIAIVDDEINARMTMRLLLERISPIYEILAEIESVEQANSILPNLEFDVLLLDIELIDGTGFEILEKNPLKNVNVIFTTAYHEHAIKAFKKNAIDYLLKPIDLDELKAALQKCQAKVQDTFNYQSLVKKIKADIFGTKIQIHSTGDIEFVFSKDIKYLKSEGAYCSIFLSDNRKLISSKPLKYYEEKLHPTKFFRINRFEMLNIDFLLTFKKNEENGIVLISDGSEFKISRRKKPAFKTWIQNKH